MRLTLPLPPSKNDAYEERAITSKDEIVPAVKAVIDGEPGAWHRVQRAMKVMRHPSKARDEYFVAVRRAAGACAPIEGDVSLRVVAYFPDRRRDLVNIDEVLLDALEGVAYGNDRQVVHFTIRREIDPQRPRVEVEAVSTTADLFEALA